METAKQETGVKSVLRELLSYKSGVFGILFLLLLVVVSVYAVYSIPYDQAVSLWRGEEGVWLEVPRNAQPTWMKYFMGNLPDTIKIDSSVVEAEGVSKRITPIIGTDLSLLRLSMVFDYDYDDFPSEINIFFNAKFNESAPLLRIFWLKPGNSTEIKLMDYIPRTQKDQLYLSTNQDVLNKLTLYASRVVGNPIEATLPTEQVLFAVEDETLNKSSTAQVLKGTYKLLIEGTLFGEDSDIDLKLVVYGKVYGIAGTDHLRRDLLIALLWGTPIALAFGLTASLTISIVQLILATVSGYYGGWIDSGIQRLTEISMIIPFLPILIMIAAFYKLDIWTLLVVVILLSIFGAGVKSTRALVMQIKEYPYIEAARTYGASSKRIVFFYIIPKILPPIIPGLIGAVPGYVFLEAALAFLGLGDPRLPTWGKIINDSFTEGALYKGYYYWILEPALMLVLTAFAFSFLGFALDKIVNPKLKEV